MTTTSADGRAAGPAARRRTTPLLCALGDSVSAGVGDRMAGSRRGVRDIPDSGWAAHLSTTLGADLLNVGRNGARARDVLRDQLPVALTAKPDLATVLIGGNDVLRGDYEIDEIRAALLDVVWQLLGAGGDVVLVVPPQIGADLPAPAVVRHVLGRRMAEVRQVVVDVAATLRDDRLVLVDADPVRSHGRHVMHIDRIHPSPLGHRLLAEHVAVTLRSRGWRPVGRIAAPPPPPGVALQAAWLLVRGVPWVARRSRDLLPELVRVVAAEQRQQRLRS